jgi:copper chaperone CopZ
MTTYRIEGMHCMACVKRVAGALSAAAGDVQVTLNPPEARLSGAALPLATLNGLVAKAGKYTLTEVAAPAVAEAEAERTWFETYFPLLLIAGYIAAASFAGATPGARGIDWSIWMTNAMAGFFLVFSAFKFLNLRGFAAAYATYDLGAKAWAPWGLVYPFLELALGLAFLFRWNLPLANLATVVLMGFSSIGVIQALAKKQTIRCACLGTLLNVPMSTITLVEDLAMVAMAAMGLAIK